MLIKNIYYSQTRGLNARTFLRSFWIGLKSTPNSLPKFIRSKIHTFQMNHMGQQFRLRETELNKTETTPRSKTMINAALIRS